METIFNLSEIKEKVRQKEVEINQDSFWVDNPDAQGILSKLSQLKATVTTFDEIKSNLEEMQAYIECLEEDPENTDLVTESDSLLETLEKDINQQRYPLFVAEMNEKKYFIIPLRGSGLWDAIWGYVALEEDMSTIKGIVFDHKGETAGLGAEITQQWFQDRFIGEKVFNSSSKLVGINVSKSNNDPKNLDKDDHEVDAISGATITGDGVSDMIIERLNHYISYFNKYKSDNNVIAMKNHFINHTING